MRFKMTKGQADIFNSLMGKISKSIRVAMPGVIQSYDFQTQKADIQLDMQELYQNNSSIEYPILSGVPVIFPKSGGASITMPVSRGDTCLVLFLDRDSTAWLLGGKNLKPKSTRAHHLSDGVAIMGLSPFSTKSPAKNNTDFCINFDGSTVTLKPKGIVTIDSAKEINIKTEGITINCKTAIVKSEESVAIECKYATLKATDVLNLECKTLNAKVSESALVECQNASIKATGNITTETPNFTQKGNMKIEGDVEVTGSSKLTGAVNSESTITGSAIKTTSGKDLATHTHTYQDVATVTAPNGPCTVSKVPANSGATN